ncbi:MAG: hypothetical protein Q4F85_08705 [Prevotella sp.]|nr:hypothetical protein [Prevotella sp.]
MKKLFTFFVFLACFLGTKAVEIVDFTVDYTQVGKSTVGWKAEIIQDEWITGDDDGLHLYNPEVTTNFYDYQLHIFNNAALEVDENYTVKIVAKVSDGSAKVRCRVGDWGGGISGEVEVSSTEYQEYILTGKATAASNFLLVQFGDYVGTVSFKSVTITHEGKEQRPVTWQNILTNGDAEGEFGEPACVQSKEFGMHLGDDGQPQVHAAEIVDEGGNKVFVCHAKEVNPVIVWDSDGEQWGVEHKAGDPMPDNAWQNQFWVVLPRAAKDGEQFKLSFRYKASRAAKVSTQDHKEPGAYLGGGSYGDLNFTTEWQEYSKEFSAAGTMQSIAFNLGQEIYTEDVDFFFDDVKVEEMVLDHGLFIASANTETGTVAYDFDNAVELTWDDDQQAYAATVGKKGDKDSWVNEVMISTVRGNDKAFKAATIKAVVKKPDVYVDYTEGSNGKIKLPAAGVWTIFVDTENLQMMASQLEGDIVKEPIDIKPNPTVVVVKGKERDYLAENEDEVGAGNPWDNQFFIIANRNLKPGEETVVEFDYVSTVEANTNTQCGGNEYIGQYLHWSCLGDVKFTTEEQHFTKEFTIPAEAVGKDDDGNITVEMNAINFNMAVIKGACDYTIKNIVWKLKDDSETLIDMEGTKNFYVKEGAGDTAHEFGTETGINSVVNDTKNSSNAIYNLAGQRVSKDYKGIVIKNGSKYIVK